MRSMRQRLVTGNWKLHGSLKMVEELVGGLSDQLGKGGKTDVTICPPFIYLDAVTRILKGSIIRLGAQDVCAEDRGAFTGEVAASMLAEFLVRYVIVGHSERRTYYCEDNVLVARKFQATRHAGLTPILCVGETLEEREQGLTESIIAAQLGAVIDQVGVEGVAMSVIAYEPLWAIGTGRTATPEQAQSVHAFIRKRLNQHTPLANACIILYGGSVKPDNAGELFAMPDIDGGLIGGASLDLDDFLAICRA